MSAEVETLHCPVCNKPRDDDANKIFRLAVWRKDERLAIMPPGTSNATARVIAQGLKKAYVMLEVLDKETGRMIMSRQTWPHKVVKG